MSDPDRPLLGVLGGMGPLATAEFLRRLVLEADAVHDADHLPVAVWGDPRVPDRVGPILGRAGPGPVPALVAGIRRLETAGATFLAMPCNTVHHWLDELRAATPLPFVPIADAVADALGEPPAPGAAALLLATRATLASGFYRAPLARRGWTAADPHDDVLERDVLPAIADVKRGRLGAARERMLRGLQACARRALRPHDVAVLACTELSTLGLDEAGVDGLHLLDATVALARACLRHAQVPLRAAAGPARGADR
ncbi:MAG: amino acid racemase [Acidobacteriota bacterium]